MFASTPAYQTTIAGASMTVEHQVTWTLPALSGLSRVNLCTDPSFEGTTTLWTSGGNPSPGGTLIGAPAPLVGSQVLRVDWDTGIVSAPGFFYALTTVPGYTYTVSSYVWVPTSFVAVTIGSQNGVSSPSTLHDQWQRLNYTFTATDITETIGINPASAPTAGMTVYFDAILIEQGTTLGSYFDGTFPNAFWTADPNRSTSQMNTNPYQDISLTVESLSVDRQLTTDMPDGTRLITGYPAATAQLTLSGLIGPTLDPAKTVAWLLNPADPTSPLYRSDALGSPLVIEAGVYTPGNATAEMYPVFTGVVDDYTVDVQAGTATLSCLDYRSKFGKAPSLPLGAFSDNATAATYNASDLGPLLTSGWVLNQFAESVGLYASPPPRTACVFRQTNHGGAWPETSWAAASEITAPALVSGAVNVPANNGWVPGMFSRQVAATMNSTFFNAPPVGLPYGTIPGDMGASGQTWFVECWVQNTNNIALVGPTGTAFLFRLTGNGSPTATSIAVGLEATALGSALRPFISVTINGVTTTMNPGLTIPLDGNWYYFANAFRYTSTTQVDNVTWVNGSSWHAATNLSGTVNAHESIIAAGLVAYTPVESVQVTNEPFTDFTDPSPNYTYATSTLVDLDPSLNQLTVVPDLTGQDAWSVIQQVAEAEGGVAGFDEAGVFRFINRDTIDTQASARTVTPTYSLKTLQQEMGLSFVRNHIQLPVSTYAVLPAATVWTSTTGYQINPRVDRTIIVNTTDPVINVSRIFGVKPPSGAVPGQSYYRAATHPTGGGSEVSNLNITATQLGPTTIAIRIINPNGYTCFLVTPIAGPYPPTEDGQPLLEVGAQAITANTGTAGAGGTVADSQWPPASEGGAATNPRGELLLTMATDPFVQNQASAQTFTDSLLGDLYQPRPLWRNVGIVPDPSLQLADLITITDPDTTLVNGTALIIGSHLQVDKQSWGQSLDLRATGAPGGWILGVAGSSELGVTTYM